MNIHLIDDTVVELVEISKALKEYEGLTCDMSNHEILQIAIGILNIDRLDDLEVSIHKLHESLESVEIDVTNIVKQKERIV